MSDLSQQELLSLHTTPALRVSYDAAQRWLYCQWLGLHDAASVAQQAEAIFACLAARPCTKLLSDHSQLLGDWQTAAPVVVRRNFERLAEYGIHQVAWVYAEDYHDRLAMEQLLRYPHCVTVEVFSDVESAYEWLRHYSCRG